GGGEMFDDEWERAGAGERRWPPVFLPWHEFSDYQMPGIAIEEPTPEECALRERFELTDAQLAWRRWSIANNTRGDIRLFRQEFPASPEEAFIQSGLPFFDPDQLLP